MGVMQRVNRGLGSRFVGRLMLALVLGAGGAYAAEEKAP